MSKESKSLTVRRKRSHIGKVFPSGVRIDRTSGGPVGKSGSRGLGVFAFAFIPKGTPIARVSGYIINDPNYSSDYCMDAGEGKVLEPGLPFCYINHACEPNCQLVNYVRESDTDESDGLETGGLTEEDMDFESNGDDFDDADDFDDDDAFYGGEEIRATAKKADDVDDNDDDDDIDDEDRLHFDGDADTQIWVEAIQDIMPNDELTIDYSWTSDRAMRCLCGKPTCRGWIVDPAEREFLPG